MLMVSLLEEVFNQVFVIVRQLDQDLFENNETVREQVYTFMMSHSFIGSIN